MANSNFQDVVVLSSDTLNAGVERLVLGSSAGSKSIVFAQDVALASAMHLVASNPTAVRTAILPDANGTLGYLTAVSAVGGSFSNGKLVFSKSNEFVWGANGSTITAALTKISNLEIGGPERLRESIQQTAFTLSSAVSSTDHTLTMSSAWISAIRISVVYPIDVTYIDPYGQQQLSISGNIGSGTWSISASASWWCGLFTVSGSTAGLLSSAIASTSVSKSSNAGGVASSVGIDPRITNITWNVTPGDYMFFVGPMLSVSASISAATANCSVKASYSCTVPGLTRVEVSYSLPYWEDGSVSASATSYHLTDVSNSGGVGFSTVRPWLRLLGS